MDLSIIEKKHLSHCIIRCVSVTWAITFDVEMNNLLRQSSVFHRKMSVLFPPYSLGVSYYIQPIQKGKQIKFLEGL